MFKHIGHFEVLNRSDITLMFIIAYLVSYIHYILAMVQLAVNLSTQSHIYFAAVLYFLQSIYLMSFISNRVQFNSAILHLIKAYSDIKCSK